MILKRQNINPFWLLAIYLDWSGAMNMSNVLKVALKFGQFDSFGTFWALKPQIFEI